MKNNKKIVFVTFLNDYSGSPNVLSIIIRGLLEKGYKTEIITNRGVGFLSNISEAKYNYVMYRWSKNPLLRSIYFFIAQCQLFFKILTYKDDNALFYINTITPIGAVWACKILKKNYIYQIHENMMQKKTLYILYRWTYRFCNTKSIFVSHYLREVTPYVRNCKVIYNSLSDDFLKQAQTYTDFTHSTGRTILMVASLKVYKGVYEFVELAKKMPEYKFVLVLNASETDTQKFKDETVAPTNIEIYSVNKNLHPFYQNTKLLLQLSHPTLWIETFGLTILEAMVYGIPAIVPNVGGPAEIVDDGMNGYTINPLNSTELSLKVRMLMENEVLYDAFSKAALTKSKQFKRELLINQIEQYLLE